jgi:4'-phosphopantetheinyl transferase EntD
MGADVQASALWRALLPEGVAVCETIGNASIADLFDEERAAIAKAVARRVSEFAAGRLCARAALAELGVAGTALPRGADRKPVWPDGFTGSITHTDGYCAAAAAPCGRFRALGIDAEHIGRIDAAMERLIATPRECAVLDTLAGDARAQAATILFSAKEAFYKCWSTAGGKFIGFQDAEVYPHDGQFMIVPSVDGPLREAWPNGHYRVKDGMVFAAMALPS